MQPPLKGTCQPRRVPLMTHALGRLLPLLTHGCGCSSGVEHDLAKVGVEGSNPFARSNFFNKIRLITGALCRRAASSSVLGSTWEAPHERQACQDCGWRIVLGWPTQSNAGLGPAART